jgi:hypothetical protein
MGRISGLKKGSPPVMSTLSISAFLIASRMANISAVFCPSGDFELLFPMQWGQA